MLRAALILILIGSLSLSAWNLFEISQNPAVTALSNRTGAELTARINRELTRAVTPERINARLRDLIAEDPPPWLAIKAVQDVAHSREIPIPAELAEQIETQYDRDHGILQASGKCISCGWDAANCALSAILLCRAPVDLTPLGDITGVVRESGNYLLGNEVDKIDLTLSAVGLSASAIAPATGGSSYAVKLGASALKTTKKIGNLSPRLSGILTKSADEAIDWKKLSDAGPLNFQETLKTAIDQDALTPVTDTLKAAGAISSNAGVIETLHLMKYVDNVHDIGQVARISEAFGPRTVSAFEVIGKSRLLRATLRYSDEAIRAILAALAALMSALGLVLSTIASTSAKKALRRIR